MLWVRFLALVLALGPVAAHAAAPAGIDAGVREALSGVWNRDLGGGLVLDQIVPYGHKVDLVIHDERGRQAARLQLRHPTREGHRVGGFSVSLQTSFSQIRSARDRQALAAIEQVVDALEQADTEGLGNRFSRPATHPWLTRGLRPYRWAPAAILALVILGWTRRDRLQWVIRPNHAVPAMIQVTLYTYWWLYTEPVGWRFVDIAAQVAFAYCFEGLLRWTRGKTWNITLGPLPVVFSTNLFVWFIEPWLQCAVIAIALASKEWVQRDGRHIFNPSALGVSVAAILTLTLPSVFGWGTPTPDVELNLPPNMAELMLLLTVLAQLRFPIVLVPMSATLGVLAARFLRLTPPDPFWPATFLILLLFATDPKTLPKQTSGRVVYGFLLGLSLSAISEVLSRSGLPDTYAKVIPIPALNYLAPQLDRVGEAIYGRWKALVATEGSAIRTAVGNALEPRYNRWHVAVWVVIAVIGISRQKADSFQVLAHWELETSHVVSATANGFPTCAENPVWCRPFSFPAEVRMWLDGT